MRLPNESVPVDRPAGAAHLRFLRSSIGIVTHIRIESVERSFDDPSLAVAAALALSRADAMGLLTRDVTRASGRSRHARSAGRYAGRGYREGDGNPPLSFLRCEIGGDRRLALANKRDVAGVVGSRARVEGVEEGVGDRPVGPIDGNVGRRRALLSRQPSREAGRPDCRTPPFPGASR